MMKTYEIMNVGQGDSIVIRPPAGCRCSKETLIVDLGPGSYDITKHIKPEDKVHIFLTHQYRRLYTHGWKLKLFYRPF